LGHHHIPAIAAALPTAPGTPIPNSWRDDRFDNIWSFILGANQLPTYSFTQMPQRLLAGDADHE